MAALDPSETYTHHPLSIDPASKTVSAPSQHSDSGLQSHIATLNALHQSMKSLETTNQIPPPPVPVNPKRSANITKMRESASTSHRKGNYLEAIRLYTFAIDMASTRPNWEPVGLVRDELALLYANRAASQMGLQNWVEGLKDGESSVECKKQNNQKAWWRVGKCLYEMGRYAEAVDWLHKARDVDGNDGDAKKDLSLLLEEAKKEAYREIKI